MVKTTTLHVKISTHLSAESLCNWQLLLSTLANPFPSTKDLLSATNISLENIEKCIGVDKGSALVTEFLRALVRVLDEPIHTALERLIVPGQENDYDLPGGMLDFAKDLNKVAKVSDQSLDDRITLLETISAIRFAVRSAHNLDVEENEYHSKALDQVVVHLAPALLYQTRSARERFREFSNFNDLFVGEYIVLNSPFLFSAKTNEDIFSAAGRDSHRQRLLRRLSY